MCVMKKRLFFIIMLFALIIPNVLALENDYYKINIPDAYEKEEADKTQELYSLTTKDFTSSILIYTIDNDNSLNISKYTSSDVKNQEETFKESMLKEYKDNDIDAEIKSLSGVIEQVNGYDSIVMNIETEYTFDSLKRTIYQ